MVRWERRSGELEVSEVKGGRCPLVQGVQGHGGRGQECQEFEGQGSNGWCSGVIGFKRIKG